MAGKQIISRLVTSSLRTINVLDTIIKEGMIMEEEGPSIGADELQGGVNFKKKTKSL